MNDKSYTNRMEGTDYSILKEIGVFVKHHRINQNKTQDDVSHAAGISRSTLSLLERGKSVNVLTLIQVLRVLDMLHVLNEFSIHEEVSPIQLAKLAKQKRERASKGKSSEKPKSDW